jgi:tetratricopeptide (TPR) repeat protein
MLPLLLTALLSLMPQSGVVTHAALLEPAQHTLELIYNMEFDAALRAAQHLIDLAPAHPAGYFYRAATYWQWRLITHDPQRRAMLLSQFQESTQRARDLAEHLPEAQAAEAAFYLGAVYGMQARMHFVEQQYIRALLAAKQGSTYLQQCVRRAPDWYDAYAGLGTYQYVLSRVPGVWRGIVQQLIGIAGDRNKGLQALEQARTAGRLSVPEAGSLLAKIYMLPGEEQYDKAYVLLENLVQRYPHNSDYRYRLALVCAQLGLWERARQVSQQLMADIGQGKPYVPQEWLPLLRYRLAETYVLQRQPQAAAGLLRSLHTQELSPELRAWVELRLGNVHDLQGERQAAQAWYQGVQGDEQAAARAHAYIAMPFVPTQIDLKPFEQAVI